MSFEIPHGNSDDSRAARLALLAALFMSQGRAALGWARIYELFYAESEPQTAAKAFSRDREALSELGIRIQKGKPAGGERTWVLDKSCLAAEPEMGAQEAIALDAACQPLFLEPGFPFLDDLRFALAKTDQNFYDAERAVELRRSSPTKVEEVIDSCIKRGCAVRIEYRDAQGRASVRDYAPCGTFSFRKKAYLVARPLDPAMEDEARTLRVDRIVRASAQRSVKVQVPADFRPEDHIKLPFQLGPVACVGEFAVPPEAEATLAAECGARGSMGTRNGARTWSVEVSDLGIAASWAISTGIRPLAPKELVDAWKSRLEEVVSRA